MMHFYLMVLVLRGEENDQRNTPLNAKFDDQIEELKTMLKKEKKNVNKFFQFF